MEAIFKYNEEIMENANVFSVIVLKVKDQYPSKNLLFLSETCFWILGEKQ